MNMTSPTLDRLAANHRQVGIALGVVGLLLAIIPIYLYSRYEWLAVWPVFIWGVCLSLVTLTHAAGFLFFMDGTGRLGQITPTERVRAYIISLGGVLGALTALLGLILPFTQYSEVFGADLKVWRQHPWTLVLTALALFGGLTLIFVTFQLARGVQRSSVVMRRFLYLYNAVFSSLLLLFILILFNVLALSHVGAFEFFTTNFDWTSYGIYTLSPKSKALLASLDQPVKVYVLMTGEDQVTQDVETLLENCRSVTDKISYETLSRDRNRTDFAKLLEKYPSSDPYGLLVLYGTEPNVAWDYIKRDDLAKEPPFNPRGGTPPAPTFTGENALMKTIDYLSQGKSKAVIYFTQGNGEPDLNDRQGDAPDKGLGVLSERIGKGNYEVKELRFDPGFKGIPEDADAVVMVRPGSVVGPVPEAGVRALRDYLSGAGGRKKGKLMVLLDVVVRPDGSMARSGLEDLLDEYGVRPGNNRILSVLGRSPTDLQVMVNLRSRNPIAQAFGPIAGRIIPFTFDDARSIEPKQTDPGGRYTVEELVQTIPQTGAWAEKDLSAQPSALVAELRKDQDKLLKTISRTPIPVGVAVTESKGPSAMPPGHPPVGGDQQPRLIVFGDASWVTNQMQNSRIGEVNFELFSNCLSWLRERPDIGTEYAEGKIRPEYNLNATPEVVSRLRWLPFGLMMLGLISVGGAVWVVRRR